MCCGKKKTTREIARWFTNDDAENQLQTVVILKKTGVGLQTHEFFEELDLAKEWGFWVALRGVRSWSVNPIHDATRISELFVDIKLDSIVKHYDSVRKLRPLCTTAIGHLCISAVRTKLNRERIERERAITLAGANELRHPRLIESRLEAIEKRRAVRRAVVHLPRNYRRAVILRDWLNASSDVGGQRLDIPPQKFDRWVHEGRRRVKKELGSDFMDEVA